MCPGGSCWQEISTGLSNGLVSLGNRSSLEPMLINIYAWYVRTHFMGKHEKDTTLVSKQGFHPLQQPPPHHSSVEIQNFPSIEMHLKMSIVKVTAILSRGDELNEYLHSSYQFINWWTISSGPRWQQHPRSLYHWHLNKMANILQMTVIFLNEIIIFWSKCVISVPKGPKCKYTSMLLNLMLCTGEALTTVTAVTVPELRR